MSEADGDRKAADERARADAPRGGAAAGGAAAAAPPTATAAGIPRDHLLPSAGGAAAEPPGFLVHDDRTRALGAPVASTFPPDMATNEQLEAFRELRTRLMLMASGIGLEHFTTMVVPVTPDSGGSFVARNLAAAFTLQEHPSLLIECNFRGHPQHRSLGPGNDAEGLFDFLSDGSNPSAVLPIWPTVVPGLRLIPAGRCQAFAGGPQREYLSSRPMKDLMTKLRGWPVFVVLDAPPVKGSPDARILSDLADFVVLVVGYGRVTQQTIVQAAALFDPKKFAGVVLNEHAAVAQDDRAG
jgi:Mrp family chromosome partitioning ATPase